MTWFSNRWLVNLALVAMVVILALAVYLTRTGESQQGGFRLTTLQPQDISRLRLQRPKRETIMLEHSDFGWRLTEPVAARANRFNVEQLLGLAQAPADLNIAAHERDLSRYGLDKPSARVWLNDTEIDFGSIHPLKNQHYVLHDRMIYLVSSRYFALAAYPYSNFIDTRLLEEEPVPVSIALRDFSVALRDGTWHRFPDIKELSADRVNRFVEEWRHASALSVERYSGTPPSERVRITFSTHEKEVSIDFGVLARKPELILVRIDEGLQYHFPEEIGKRLLNLTPDQSP